MNSAVRSMLFAGVSVCMFLSAVVSGMMLLQEVRGAAAHTYLSRKLLDYNQQPATAGLEESVVKGTDLIMALYLNAGEPYDIEVNGKRYPGGRQKDETDPTGIDPAAAYRSYVIRDAAGTLKRIVYTSP
ncbi:hypothetical protein [Paenibacillus sp. UNC499MF]|uniref:hypothetical protein n=1 Tax=Paenibacillus sp. UNC499MF TaxID=1502751 RepID=UPI0008A023EF|nr:hypothetical protein [Paenibacillus sp. UNC499MF]SEF53812.1 hypothetical protein SAMN02799616_00405 [Paenibacillus sp. UNC499MF]